MRAAMTAAAAGVHEKPNHLGHQKIAWLAPVSPAAIWSATDGSYTVLPCI